MDTYDDSKWFLVWSHGRGPKRREKYVLFPKEVYEDDAWLKGRVEDWATSTWSTSEQITFGWKEVKRLPDEILSKEINGAQDRLKRAVDYLAYLVKYKRGESVT